LRHGGGHCFVSAHAQGSDEALPSKSLKIVNHHLFDQPPHVFFHELDVLRMHLKIVLGLLVRKNEVQRDLVTLLDHRTMAGHHFADVKLHHARDVFEQLVRAGEEFIRGIRVGRISPKNDDV
jgi:hypothetical protein